MSFRCLQLMRHALGALVALALLGTPGAIPRSDAQVADVRVVNETAPAGGLAVVQIELTDPEPIFSGRYSFTFPAGGPLRRVRGIGLFSDLFDVIAAARIRLGRVDVKFASFSARMGVSEDLPIFVVAADVDSNAVKGESSILTLDPNELELIGPNGQPYMIDLKPGGFTVGGLSLNSVTPSTGIVPAGTTLVFRGVGFDPDADLDIEGVSLTNVRVISAAEIRAVAGQTFRIEGRRIRVRNKDADEEEFFFVFTPATMIGSTEDPLLKQIVPIFDDTTLTSGVLRNVDSGSGSVTGVAFQNTGSGQAEVTVRVFDGDSALLGQAILHLSSGERSLHEISELVPVNGAVSGGIVGALSTQPVKMLGLVGLATDATLAPLPFSDEEAPDMDPSDPPGSPGPPDPPPDPPGPPDPPLPAISQGGVVLATLAPSVTTVAPRSIATVFGLNFATDGFRRSVATADLVDGRLPTKLGGVCVEVAGTRASMLFTGSEQLNFQVPDVAAKGPVSLEVIVSCDTAGETRTGVEVVNLSGDSPGFFVMRFDGPAGANPIAALHGGGPELVGEPKQIPGASPARPGEFVSFFGTGFGLTIPHVGAGEIPANLGHLHDGQAVLASEVAITVGGIAVPPEDVFYAGVAPCCAGLDQLVVKVPSAAPSGSLPVEARINGISTPSGPYVTVQGP